MQMRSMLQMSGGQECDGDLLLGFDAECVRHVRFRTVYDGSLCLEILFNVRKVEVHLHDT